MFVYSFFILDLGRSTCFCFWAQAGVNKPRISQQLEGRRGPSWPHARKLWCEKAVNLRLVNAIPAVWVFV